MSKEELKRDNIYGANTQKMTATEIEQKIKAIRALDLETTPFSEVHRRVRDLMIGYSTVSFPGRRLQLYRARTNPTKDNFLNVKELMYPPANLVKEFGRANDIGEPVLYCAGAAETAVLELHPFIGDEITIMEVEYDLSNQPGGVIGIGLSDKAILKNPGKDIVWGDYRNDSIGRFLYQYHPRQVEEKLLINKLIDSFMDEEFRRKASRGRWEYKITASVSKIYLNNPQTGNRLAAITYPSIAHDSYEINWAMNTGAADKALIPRRFKKIRIIDRTEKGGYIQEPVCHTGKCDASKNIIW